MSIYIYINSISRLADFGVQFFVPLIDPIGSARKDPRLVAQSFGAAWNDGIPWSRLVFGTEDHRKTRWYTIWLFNIAMEHMLNKGFSMAMSNNQMVIYILQWVQ